MHRHWLFGSILAGVFFLLGIFVEIILTTQYRLLTFEFHQLQRTHNRLEIETLKLASQLEERYPPDKIKTPQHHKLDPRKIPIIRFLPTQGESGAQAQR